MTILTTGHMPTKPGIYAFNDGVSTLAVRVFEEEGILWQESVGAGIRERVDSLDDGICAWSEEPIK